MNPIFETDKYKTVELKTFTSIKALSAATGLERKLLVMAKERNFPGFCNNNTVNWPHLKPTLEARYEELLKAEPCDIKTLKEELAKRDIRIKDLNIRKLEGNLLEPDDVKKFLVELATKQSVVLKKELLELPPKLAGKSEMEIKVAVDKALANIFKVLQSGEGAVNKLSNGH